MVFTHTKNNLVICQNRIMEFINIILLHINQSQIQGVILNQIAGADRAVFFQNDSNFRMLPAKGSEQFREKDRAQHGRNPDAKRRFHSCHAGVVSLKLGAVLKNVGGFFVKCLSLLGKDQLISFPVKKTASICAIGLTITGVLDVSTTFSQYVNSNVILCVGMFVVGQALFETGMANKIGGLVTKFARTEKTLIIAIMAIVGVMSGFLSNTGTAAVLIPVVCGIADESGYSRSRLLMPLVFAAALGGNLSIIGAPGNLMGVNALQEMGLSTSFFMYAPVGIPMLIVGILYFIFIGYRFLPDGKGAAGAAVEEQKDFSDVPKWKQIVSLVVLV